MVGLSLTQPGSDCPSLCLGVQVMILITGAHKAFALYKAIEDGVNHMWTVSAFQQHPNTVFVCDEDATLELKVKTVKYFKGERLTRPGSCFVTFLGATGHALQRCCCMINSQRSIFLKYTTGVQV